MIIILSRARTIAQQRENPQNQEFSAHLGECKGGRSLGTVGTDPAGTRLCRT